ncbi:peptidoglycan DD-metalloendopeptidase family protein [Candidatus Thiothrix sp. Deng01]|uniref:Peptidoglycan DD-metalloendopeptidase family protein n=1 Tax=Candidatus Thiothrix phosphatis TaxID=3112415 RepID=A0ABU6CWF9_9GAMM|nr:peptidoglycan DD-metalloendopeptidase family protein [Candidatus Thiothrix sp. Deng01]MEB4590422.1 peptidoglycan DD-metalloendopeptidase family protein [Candidatus Thiothrix sp. Deng01]
MKLYPYLFYVLLLFPWGWLEAADVQQQKQLQQEIRQLSTTLSSQKTESQALQDEVTKLEKKLGDISSKSYQTEKKIDATLAKLETANQKKVKLDTDLGLQKAGLAQQLQALYSAGEQSHLRLLLRQDEPSDISRTIRYFEYLNENRVKRIQGIQKTLGELDAVRTAIEKDRTSLQELTQTLAQQKTDIESTLQARSTALGTIKSDIRSKEKRLNKLKAEETELQGMVDRLASATAKNQERALDSRAQTPKSASSGTSKQTSARQSSTSDKEDDGGTPVKTGFTPDKPFSSLRGKLFWPVKGRVIHSYGSSRNEKQRWKGVVIAAPGGTKVRAIARGRVAFSGWMDGYGHLIIIEHDNNYMSLYGYNRAVYKKEGAVVSANEAIAAVGNSSGQSQDALYFEIRQGTTPQNPARWCQ